ncbi:MAG: AI-2E family transporter [Amphiplicatus sp.]|nr:AI-2E family transporter [Amphiplicatus sp.]
MKGNDVFNPLVRMKENEGAPQKGASADAPRRPRRFSASHGDTPLQIIAVSCAFLAFAALAGVLYFARPLLIPVAAAFVASVLLLPFTKWITRRGAPLSLASLLVVLVSLAAFTLSLYLVIEPGVAWFERLPDVIERARGKLARVHDAMAAVKEVSDQVNQLTDIEGEGAKAVVSPPQSPLGETLIALVRSTTVQLLFSTVLTYFFLAQSRELRRKAIVARCSLRGMLQSARSFRAIEKKVGAYMATMFSINLGLGLAVGVAMWAIGMPSPAVWGGLAAILNFVPFLGPTVMTALLGTTSLVTYDTLGAVILAPSIYIVLNFIESNFVTPTLMGARLTINPLAVILNISFWTFLWGPIGAVLSIPMLVIFKTVCDYSEFMRPLSILLGDSQTFTPRKDGPVAMPDREVVRVRPVARA